MTFNETTQPTIWNDVVFTHQCNAPCRRLNYIRHCCCLRRPPLVYIYPFPVHFNLTILDLIFHSQSTPLSALCSEVFCLFHFNFERFRAFQRKRAIEWKMNEAEEGRGNFSCCCCWWWWKPCCEFLCEKVCACVCVYNKCWDIYEFIT